MDTELDVHIHSQAAVALEVFLTLTLNPISVGRPQLGPSLTDEQRQNTQQLCEALGIDRSDGIYVSAFLEGMLDTPTFGDDTYHNLIKSSAKLQHAAQLSDAELAEELMHVHTQLLRPTADAYLALLNAVSPEGRERIETQFATTHRAHPDYEQQIASWRELWVGNIEKIISGDFEGPFNVSIGTNQDD